MKLLVFFFSLAIFFEYLTHPVIAGCGPVGGSSEGGCPGTNDNTGCFMTSSSSFDQTDCYNNGCGGYNCSTTSYTCSASDGHTGDWWAVELCLGHGSGGCVSNVCSGGPISFESNDCQRGRDVCLTCNNDWPDGRPRNHEACCTDDYHVGCSWDQNANGGNGWCDGPGSAYQCQSKCDQKQAQSECTSRDCDWTPCANGSVCTGGTCTDNCGNDQSCNHYYNAISPTGGINTSTPTLTWATDNVDAPLPSPPFAAGSRTYTCLGIFGRNTACRQGESYIMSTCPSVSSRSTPFSSLACTAEGISSGECSGTPALSPNTQYSWNVYGYFPNTDSTGRQDGTSNCLRFTTPAATPAPTPPPIPAWWQVKDADVISKSGITSRLPSGNFDLAPVDGYPGVVVYDGGGSANFGSGAVSQSPPFGWIANSDTQYRRIYDYNFFKSQIPAEVSDSYVEITTPVYSGGNFSSQGSPARGYVWFHFDGNNVPGDLTIDQPINLVGSRKVVLLVENADLNINAKVDIQSNGNGFFMAVVGKKADGSKGNIFIDATVGHQPNQGNPPSNNAPDIEGIFLADNNIETDEGNDPIYMRGSFIAHGSISLERTLGSSNSTTPAEFFEYAPELMTLYPNVFATKRLRWKEVVP